MFKNYYTTQMSADAKKLQMRFLKMRSDVGKGAKIMSVVMTAVILITTLFATVVMAAVGSDGLEHWDKNEAYFLDGAKFSINVLDKNVPGYVTDDIVGTDGNINVTLNRYQTRNVWGRVSIEHVVQMTGQKGTIKMSANGYSSLNETTNIYPYGIDDIQNYKYTTDLTFIEWYDDEGWAGHENEPVAQLVDKPTDKGKYINIIFAVDEHKKIQQVFVKFSKENTNQNPMDENYDFLSSDNGSISYIGNFENDYISDCAVVDKSNYYFTVFEENFINTKNENADIKIIDAQANSIKIKTDIKIPKAEYVKIYVYNKDGIKVSDCDKNESIKTEYNLTPNKLKSYQMINDEPVFSGDEDVSENHIKVGEKYKVCVVVLDKNDTVLYRWQNYVTISASNVFEHNSTAPIELKSIGRDAEIGDYGDFEYKRLIWIPKRQTSCLIYTVNIRIG